MKMNKQGKTRTYAISAVLLLLMIGSIMATAPMLKGKDDLNIVIGPGHLGDNEAGALLFRGDGYILSLEDNKFHPIELEILQMRSDLFGTFKLRGMEMEIEGKVIGGAGSPGYSASFIEFDIKYKGYVIGSFDGMVKKAGSLRILEGTFQGNIGNEWSVLATNN